MKVLFIEDNDIKYRRVAKWLEEAFPLIALTRARSYHSGVREAIEGNYRKVILDMTLPAYDELGGVIGRDPIDFGGENVLREIVRRKVPVEVILLTQYKSFPRGDSILSFSQMREELLKRFSGVLLECVYLEPNKTNWQSELEKFLKNNENTDC